MRVKICGITNVEDALAACDAGADALGFVFAPEAKRRGRYIEPDVARAIIAQLPPFVTTVAVCANEPVARLAEYLEFVDRVQLCGEEPVETCTAVGPRAIKVFRVSAGFEPEALLAYPTPAYLLDACAANAPYGGAGKVCDWQAARDVVALGRPVILAGGLTPENVGEAVRQVRPYAVDVSGSIQRAPGKKDHDLMRSFIENAKLPIS